MAWHLLCSNIARFKSDMNSIALKYLWSTQAILTNTSNLSLALVLFLYGISKHKMMVVEATFNNTNLSMPLINQPQYASHKLY